MMAGEKEALFSQKNKRLLIDPLNDDNPVTVQVLGICSALAITVQLKAAYSHVIGCNVRVGIRKLNCFVIEKSHS